MIVRTVEDIATQRAVTEALGRTTGDSAVPIGVAVRDGVVNLYGTVAIVSDKFAAEEAAQRVPGVRAVANDLVVRWTGESLGAELARRIVASLAEFDLGVGDKIAVGVQNGWVNLAGHVTHAEDRNAVATCVRRLPGVKGVVEQIAVAKDEPALVAADRLGRPLATPVPGVRPLDPVTAPSRDGQAVAAVGHLPIATSVALLEPSTPA